MKSDTVMRNEEPFDYTEWQNGLWEGKTVKDISDAAMIYRKYPTN